MDADLKCEMRLLEYGSCLKRNRKGQLLRVLHTTQQTLDGSSSSSDSPFLQLSNLTLTYLFATLSSPIQLPEQPLSWSLFYSELSAS